MKPAHSSSLLIVVLGLLTSCTLYLPGNAPTDDPSNEESELSDHVRVSLGSCSSNSASGLVENESGETVIATLRVQWLGPDSHTLDEAELSVSAAQPGTSIQWSVQPSSEFEHPRRCVAQLISVEAAS